LLQILRIKKIENKKWEKRSRVRLKEIYFFKWERGGEGGSGREIYLFLNGRRRGNEEERKKMEEGE
jgi:hypothetical protein